MKQQRGSVEAIREIVQLGGGITVEDMAVVGELAVAAGGGLVGATAYTDDPERCGTGVVRFPIPVPDPTGWVSFLNNLVDQRINFEVLINGIPVPDQVLFNVSRGQAW